MSGSEFELKVTDEGIAVMEYKAGKVYIKGVGTGQTKASIKSGSVTHEFVITVREKAGNGWL